MRAVVTGGAGFVGRHVVRELIHRNWIVESWDVSQGWDALERFRTVHTAYDLVVHAAASSPHRVAIDREPVHMARNVELDGAMFRWAVKTHQRRVLYFSSCAAVDPDIDNYGWTKLTGERLAAEARKAGVKVSVVRPYSGYGEDQSEDFPFRAFMDRAIRRENPFTVWGDGSQVRDWIHIDDVVAGALAVVEDGTIRPVDICTGIGTSMFKVAKMACEDVGYDPEFEFRLDQPRGSLYRVGDPTLFHQIYKPKVTLAEGIHRALTLKRQGR